MHSTLQQWQASDLKLDPKKLLNITNLANKQKFNKI
jgi:hypothetical protein